MAREWPERHQPDGQQTPAPPAPDYRSPDRRTDRRQRGEGRRAVVVGAGPGGLAAAMLLARSGADVTLLERRDRIGGRTGRIEQQGFRFDLGPTFFLYPRIIEEIFQACGSDLHRHVTLTRLDPLYRLVFEDDQDLRVWADPQRLAAEIARLAPADAGNLPQYLADNRGKLASFRPVLERPFNGLRDLLSPPVLRALAQLRPWASVDRDLARHFQDPRIRLAFSFQSKYLGMSPFRCPSLFTILSFLEHEHGVWHPGGGCSAVLDAMARVARDLGVRIRLNEPVEEVLFTGRRATAVRTAAGHYAADAVIINADFAQSMRRLVPNHLRRRWRDERIDGKSFSCSTFMLYLGIEGRVDLDHHTILLARDYARNLDEIEQGRAPPSAPSLYVQNAGITDPTLAPPGHSTLYVLLPVGNLAGGIDWPRETARFRALALDRLRLLGLGDLERRIRFEQIMTPRGWADDLAVFRGATFNLAHGLDQMLHRRPHNRFEDVDGVYLVGGGTHPGSGLPVIFEGARITARLAADDLGLRFPALAEPRFGAEVEAEQQAAE
ncbi:phytoene desaturase family protein [Oleisolibacter albus]|uniref:phytoene desaturase family protein n=1 Tax=Oleisolibacter albus TaxID=2171757 RepID=UPI000DF49596|nr:phytoene desaturase family protein [Oleisolibacter albus]